MPTPTSETSTTIDDVVDKHTDDLVELRRDLHAHPELSWNEHRTTEQVADRLGRGRHRRHPDRRAPGCSPTSATGRPARSALRADLDALPVEDTTGTPWASTNPGVAHACGHDVHTAGLVGAGAGPRRGPRARAAPGPGRGCCFQPAEEVMPGGALLPDGPGRARRRRPDLHAPLRPDPRRRPGRPPRRGRSPVPPTRCRSGSPAAAATPRVPTSPRTSPSPSASSSPSCPSVVSRRLDPRAGVSVVWGMVRAGAAHNVIPETRPRRRHRPDARPARLGRGRGPGPGADRRDRRARTA